MFMLLKSSERQEDHCVSTMMRLYEYELPVVDKEGEDVEMSMIEPQMSRKSSVKRNLSWSFKKSR